MDMLSIHAFISIFYLVFLTRLWLSVPSSDLSNPLGMKPSINPDDLSKLILAANTLTSSFIFPSNFRRLLNYRYSLLTLIIELSFFENARLLNLTCEHQKQDSGRMRT